MNRTEHKHSINHWCSNIETVIAMVVRRVHTMPTHIMAWKQHEAF